MHHLPSAFPLVIADPGRLLFEGRVQALFLRGEEGCIEILPHHADISLSLVPGEIFYVTEEGERTALESQCHGFFHMKDNRASLLLL